MTEFFRLHERAAVKRPRIRPQRNGPITTQTVDPLVMAVAVGAVLTGMAAVWLRRRHVRASS